MRLSRRLEHIYDLVPDCRTAADIGTDHALLPIALISRGRAGRVLACDVLEGPLSAAKENVRRAGLSGRIRCLSGDGFHAMDMAGAGLWADAENGRVRSADDGIGTAAAPGDESLAEWLPEAAVICGMGGLTIKHILEGRDAAGPRLKTFILGPQSETEALRRYLREKGLVIEREDMVCEDGKYYPLIRALADPLAEACADAGMFLRIRENAAADAWRDVPGTDAGSDPDCDDLRRICDMFGPCLLAQGHPVLKDLLEKRLRTDMELSTRLASSGSERAAQKLRDVREDERLTGLALDICLERGR